MRKYASFFEWPEDRSIAERGVVINLVESLADRNERQFHSVEIQKPDPPDCVCLNESNERVAIEVTEVVCEDAARLNAKGYNVFRNWKVGELANRVAEQLADKDSKQFHGAPYAEVIVCLFTDEPLLTIDRIRQELGELHFGPFKQVTSAYLLVSYDPMTKTYPAFTIKLKVKPLDQ